MNEKQLRSFYYSLTGKLVNELISRGLVNAETGLTNEHGAVIELHRYLVTKHDAIGLCRDAIQLAARKS